MTFQDLTISTDELLTHEKLSILAQNDEYLNMLLNERPKGLIGMTQAVSTTGTMSNASTALTANPKKIMSLNLTIEPSRIYLIEGYISKIQCYSSGTTRRAIVSLRINKSQKTFIKTAPTETDSGTSSKYATSTYIPFIWRSPENLKKKKVTFSIWAKTSTIGTSGIHSLFTHNTAGTFMSVTDLGSSLRQVTAR